MFFSLSFLTDKNIELIDLLITLLNANILACTTVLIVSHKASSVFSEALFNLTLWNFMSHILSVT